MKNIIFLDVDGVLNCELFYKEQYGYVNILEGMPIYKAIKRYLRKLYNIRGKIKDADILAPDYYKSQICKKRIGWLNELCCETNAVVVISASMGSGKTIEQLQEIFDYCGGTFKIIGKTCYSGYERGVEISKWLKDNINIEEYGCNYYDFYNYVIIDDDSDMLLQQQHHFFQTDNYSGLTPTTCYKIKQFFTKKQF